MIDQPKIGILLINLGTPDAANIKSVRQFLIEFLLDPRVIDISAPLRHLLVKGIIAPFRPFKTVKAYQAIWQAEGSPLLYYSMALKNNLQEKLGDAFIVEMGMRYGNPRLETAIHHLIHSNCEQIIILPLFPQYASASSGTAIEKALTIFNQYSIYPRLKIINDFFIHPQFIQAYAQIIKENIAHASGVQHQDMSQFSEPDLYLFSYHGLPERQVIKAELKGNLQCDRQDECPPVNGANRYCYRAQCFATSRALANELELKPHQYRTAFQSRLGRIPWIKPYTNELLIQLHAEGIKRLAIVCPSFVTDCLETLEEIGIRAKEQWLELGGESLQIIPCLNAHPVWVDALKNILLT